MEEYVAGSQRPLRKCLDDVASCDIYIGIFARRYGYIPQEDNPQGKSITEREYDHAGKRGKQRLIFLLDPKIVLNAEFTDHISKEGDGGQRIDQFRERLMTNHVCSTFGNPDELSTMVIAAVELAQRHDVVDETAVQLYLQEVRKRFITHMRRTIGAGTDEEVVQTYLPLRLQDNDEVQGETGSEKVTRFVSWEDLIESKPAMLVMGSAGSGKTTLLLHIARSLAERALDDPHGFIPIYLPLHTIDLASGKTLLNHMASANNLSEGLLGSLWKQRRLCLLLGGAEKVHPQRIPGLIDAIKNLCADSASANHRVIITCRLNANRFRTLLEATKIYFHHVLIASLNDSEIRHLLRHYRAPGLFEKLDESLYEVMQSPELLSALARSYRDDQDKTAIPRNAGQIYKHLIDHFIFGSDSTRYSYYYVKRPVLANLAYTMLLHDEESPFETEDQVYAQIAAQLESLHQRYHRHRNVMPATWNAQELLDELTASPVLEQSNDGRLRFSKRCYQDYFAAVHIALEGADSPALERIMIDDDFEHRLPILINLLGLLPQPEPLLKIIHQKDQGLAIQLWLENRPMDPGPIPTVTESFEQERTILANSQLVNLDEPVSAAIVLRMLNSSDPRERLRATGALTQRGLSMINALIDAAEDDHPLVRAVAKYAMLHIGEGDYTHRVKRPVPPLLGVEDESFSFQSHGGCNARIGPLNLIDVPNTTTTHLTLNIKRIDFDPFAVETECTIEHTPPSLLAAQLFEAMGSTDWMCLLSHYRLIAEYSYSLAEKIEEHKLLNDLSRELAERAARYDWFGQALAQDIGLPWEPVVPNRPDHFIENVKAYYRKLRRIYNYSSRSRLAEIPTAWENSTITVNQSIKENHGVLAAIKAEDLKLHPEAGCAQDGSRLLTYMEFAQCIEHNNGGVWFGIEINELHSTVRPLPLVLRVNGAATIENATESTINGLLIHNLLGGGWGWKTALRINIGNFANSKLAGVVVEKHKLNRSLSAPSAAEPLQPIAAD
jgi:hypothetical protein